MSLSLFLLMGFLGGPSTSTLQSSNTDSGFTVLFGDWGMVLSFRAGAAMLLDNVFRLVLDKQVCCCLYGSSIEAFHTECLLCMSTELLFSAPNNKAEAVSSLTLITVSSK